jgi:dTDP-glucose 4,6-dehydratase
VARLLVTGGAGFIGANFVHFWLTTRPDDTVVVLDALTYAGNVSNLAHATGDSRYSFVHGDIRDEATVERVLRDHRITVVVHFAAESHVDRSILGPDEFIRTNVVGTHALLMAARRVWSDQRDNAVRFHHVSTDEVYGSLGPDDPPFSEATAYAPNSPYAASKAASDHLVRAYHHTYGLPVSTSNCSNNYGPYQFPEKLVPLMLLNALEGRPLPVYGDGGNVRDWLYVEDHCRGIGLVLDRGQVGETYNLGGSCERTNLEVIHTLCRLVDSAFAESKDLGRRFPHSPAAKGRPTSELITFVKDRPGHDRRYAMNIEKARRELGFEPAESLDSGMAKAVRWYLGHEDWWRAVVDGRYRDWVRRQYGERDLPPAPR